MACPAVTSGHHFLVDMLSHIDCQAQTIGNVGFQSLSTPGSPAATLLTALLTLFIALFGIRLLFGERLGAADAIGAILKIAIAMTLALNWPAYRVLAYDTVLYGPAEVAAMIGSPQEGLAQQLQGIDDKIASLTVVSTGRQAGAQERPDDNPDAFRSIALSDEIALGWGRVLFLGATIGSLATVRIAAGLLLALAPIFAGLLLFDATYGLFSGWFRGLVLTALGSLGLTLLLAIQAGLMEPWLTDILSRRQMNYSTPSAPTELVALALAFAIAEVGLLALLSRVAFQNSWPFPAWFHSRAENKSNVPPYGLASLSPSQGAPAYLRAETVRQGMLAATRREDAFSEERDHRIPNSPSRGDADRFHTVADSALGSSYRRNVRRSLPSQSHRDTRP
jgi:type IV secretion system protein VirB6